MSTVHDLDDATADALVAPAEDGDSDAKSGAEAVAPDGSAARDGDALTEAGRGFRWRLSAREPRLRGSWRTLLAALAAVLASVIWGSAWAVSSPVGSAPDEDFHLTTIWCLRAGVGSTCETKYLADGTAMVRTYAAFAQPCFAHQPNRSAACQEIGDELAYTFRINAGGYPEGFYRALHLLASDSIAQSVIWMRIANVLLLVVPLAITYWLATPRLRTTMAFTLAVTLVPVGIFMVASVNPSSWAISGIAAEFFALLALGSAAGRARTVALGSLAVLGAVAASSARGDAGAYAVVVAFAVAWQTIPDWWRGHRRWLAPLFFMLAALPGLVSYLTAEQTKGIGSSEYTGEHRISNLLEILQLPLGNLGFGVLGRLGWLDTTMPAATWGTVSLAFGFVLVVGFTALGWRSMLGAMGILTLMIGLPYYMLERSNFVVGEFVQPRYVLPLLIVFVGMLLYRPARELHGPSLSKRWLVVITLASVANSAALYVNLLRYTNGSVSDVLGDKLDWWWPSPIVPTAVWALGSVAFAVALVPLLRGMGTSRPAEIGRRAIYEI